MLSSYQAILLMLLSSILTGADTDPLMIEILGKPEPTTLQLPTLLPGKKYEIRASIVSKVDETVDLGKTKSSCGCVVLKPSQQMLSKSDQSEIVLSVTTPSTARTESFQKTLVFFAAKDDKSIVQAVNLVAEIKPYVTCVSPVRVPENGTVDFNLKFTSDEIDFESTTFIQPKDSVFSWGFERMDKKTARVRVSLKDKSSPFYSRSIFEVLTVNLRPPIGRVFVPINFEISRPPSIAPQKAFLNRDGVCKFTLIGTFAENVEYEVFAGSGDSEIKCNFTRKNRSVRVSDFTFEVNDENIKHLMLKEGLVFRYKSADSWISLVMPVVSNT